MVIQVFKIYILKVRRSFYNNFPECFRHTLGVICSKYFLFSGFFVIYFETFQNIASNLSHESTHSRENYFFKSLLNFLEPKNLYFLNSISRDFLLTALVFKTLRANVCKSVTYVLTVLIFWKEDASFVKNKSIQLGFEILLKHVFLHLRHFQDTFKLIERSDVFALKSPVKKKFP